MRISDRVLSDRLRRIEAVSEGNLKRLEDLSAIDVTSHIADCYKPLHEDICSGGHEFYNLPGGRGSGKSSFVSLELVNGIMRDPSKLSNALVVRKFAITLRGSVFAQIQWAINTLGVGNRWKATVSPLQFTFETGQVIRLTGLDDPQKLKSMKPNRGYFKYLWMEEFSEINGEPEMRNLQQSVLRGGDRFTVFRSFNPPISRSNWANAFISIPDDRAITLLTDYRQIPVEWLGQQFFDEAERLRKINPQAYENEYLGLAVGNGAEVFPNLEIREITDQEINHLQYIYQGQDFGFASDPAAFVRLGYDAKHDTIYFIDELYVTKWSNAAVCDWIKEKGYNDYLVICDSAEPKSIADFIDNSIWARGCYKKPGAVVYRIKWLQHRRIVIDPKRTPNSSREFQNYAYKVDSKTGEVLPELPDKNNHTIDACAYAMNSVIWQRYNNTTA